MRTNLPGLALTVGMGLIVVLLGLLGLSAAGLVGFSASAVLAEQSAEAGSPAQGAAKDSGTAPISATKMPLAAGGDAVAIAAGDALFKANCTQCHAVNEKVVGPALAGIARRRPTSWVVSWVHNSAKVIASSDEYAVKLFNDNGKQQMPSFPQLTEAEVKSIVVWITSQEGTGTVAIN